MRDSFIFYTEYAEVLNELTAEQAGHLIRAMVDYARGELTEIDDKVVKAVFKTIKPRMDRDREKWEAEIEKRREAGRKGGQARAENARQRQADASDAKQSQAEPSNAKERQAIQADNDADAVYDSNNKPPKGGTGGKETQAQLLERLLIGRAVSHDIADALSEWVSYKTQRNERYKEAGMRSLITQAVNTAAENGPQAVIDAINLSMASNYKGIVWDRAKSRTGRFNNAPARSYNMDDLERKILASN